MKKITVFCFIILSALPTFALSEARKSPRQQRNGKNVSFLKKSVQQKPLVFAKDIVIEKDLTYDKHTLADTYSYKDTERKFQWDKMQQGLAMVENIQRYPSKYGYLQNRRNVNGKAPKARDTHENDYKGLSDQYGTEQYQAIPLYLTNAPDAPERYAVDGSLIKIIDDSTDTVRINMAYYPGEWKTDKKYIKTINDSVRFTKVIFVDATNQNIAALEKVGDKWLVRSMNPATTGAHRPPFEKETPLGIFVVQEKKPKMIYLHDGSAEVAGFAPYASRFSNGGYIHGVPVAEPRTELIEFSSTLGTTPRSHMCVRNATSHAKFIYDWAPVSQAIVFVIE